MGRARVSPEYIDIDHPAVTRAILMEILDNTHVVGVDDRGWPIIRHEFACPPWLLDKLACYGSHDIDLEDDEREGDVSP